MTLPLIYISLYLIYTFKSPFYMSLTFFPSPGMTSIAPPKYKLKKKTELHTIYHQTTHLSKHPFPSFSDFFSSLFQGLNPNNCLDSYPVTDASHEGRIIQFLNCIQPDTGLVGEESMEVLGSRFGPGGGDKIWPAPLGHSYLDLTFYTAYRSIVLIWLTTVF